MAASFRRVLLVMGACAGLASVPLCPDQAVAQSKDDLAKARRLFRQGLSLEAAGDFAGALAKFDEVAKVKLTPQVRFHMGRCKEELGRLNEALGDYRLAEYEAREAGAKELPEISAAKEKLEARVPKLVITLGEGAEGATVELDGVELGSAKVGKETVVDPGSHTVVVRLPNGGKWEETVDVTEGESKALELVPPEDLQVETPPADIPDVPPDDEPTPEPKPEESSSAVPWIIGGVGAVSLVASGVFFLMKNGAESDLDGACRGSVCPKSVEDKQSSGESYAMWTNVTLGIGVVGIGVAAVMLLTGGSSSPEPAREAKGLRWDVGTTKAFSGVRLSGQF
ncbi:MAG: PEGA domain-containing protein [Polyangiaceae bacterium]|nr:PEGA domain-containing protein [Polyangiaceae bacterium]MCB9607888.1 PEGA domain-containing protein [Polyangiaceae bacterium]